MTSGNHIGSHILLAVIVPMMSLGCPSSTEANPTPSSIPHPSPGGAKPAPPTPPLPEPRLGVPDRGIWGDLDEQVQLDAPVASAERASATIDQKKKLLVLSIDGFPRKVYPLDGTARLVVGTHELALRTGDRAELAPLLTASNVTTRAPIKDRDGDGIPDPLDVLIGAKKAVLNGDAYTEGYVSMKYPMGDVPRTMGVCTDVIIRAVRNAGLDLQQALHEDIAKAPRAYPMVKGKGNPEIDQRRVATLLPYFKRHWSQRSARLDDPDDPLRPGDVIFMDTFPSRSGPDHIGILSDRVNAQGQPLVINNWTNGTVTAEMDLLTFVPVLHRFRLPPS